jgi:hypothetical protein
MHNHLHVPRDELQALLGTTVLGLWSNLPRDLQERIFEYTVSLSPRGEAVRDSLALLLHHVHERTRSAD